MDDLLRRNRKYSAFWAVFLSSIVLLFFDKIDGSQWVDVVSMVYGLFMVGNGLEHGAEAWKERGK